LNAKKYAGSISALLTILTIKNWNFQTYAFPVYIFIVVVNLFLLTKFKLGKILK